VTVKMRMSRRRGTNGDCERLTFADRPSERVSPYVRRTGRIAELVHLFGHGVGGKPGEGLFVEKESRRCGAFARQLAEPPFGHQFGYLGIEPNGAQMRHAVKKRHEVRRGRSFRPIAKPGYPGSFQGRIIDEEFVEAGGLCCAEKPDQGAILLRHSELPFAIGIIQEAPSRDCIVCLPVRQSILCRSIAPLSENIP
jgi:hypothetical protein